MITVLKKNGGIVGLSQDEIALVKITFQLAHILEHLHGFPSHSIPRENESHHELVGDVALRIQADAKKKTQSIKLRRNVREIRTRLRHL